MTYGEEDDRPKKPKTLTWPNGKKVAVSITVMFETWPEDSAPNYSVQTTHLKTGHRRSRRQGMVHLRRPGRRLAADAHTRAARHPGDVLRQRRCTEDYPDAVKQIAKSGFDIAAHSYTQDDLPSY